MNFWDSSEDLHSFAKPELARVTHTHLELNVDFERKVLIGKAILTIQKIHSINEIILDNNGLDILSITSSNGTFLDYHINKNPINLHTFGTPIYIKLSSETVKSNEFGTMCTIQIEYATNPESPALNWLTSAQTADNLCPFLLSNNKLIYARAMFPCQDTPSVKFTYSAKITVQSIYTVLMSACSQEPKSKNDLLEYNFFQTNPIPSYAVIIAVGKLENRQLNSKTNIFSERKFIEKCLYTFRSNVFEKMLEITENLCGSYSWNTYDICVLPPSIAHFEIECPCVLFISPILLGGDCSCISSFLALGISQNWAGNLVTCSNYKHIWLNKSFSLFISRKIICKMLEHFAYNFHRDMNLYFTRKAIINLNSMVDEFKNTNSLKCLLPNLTGSSSNVVAYVPYERGYMILRCLEDKLGESVFESFLKSYFHKFAYESINTQDWLNYLYEYIRQSNPDKENILHGTEWNEFFYDIPCPLDVPELTVLERECFDLTKEWIKYDYGVLSNIDRDLTDKDFCDLQKIIFLNHLNLCHEKWTEKSMKLLSSFYFSNIQTDLIRFVWLLLCIKARWVEQVSSALEFAVQFCSPIHASPLFRHLYDWPEMRDKAIKTYRENREKMFHETQKTLDALLFQNS